MRTKVSIPPPTQPIDIGEVDISLIKEHGVVSWFIGRKNFAGHAVDIPGGCLVYVPSVQAKDLV